MRTTPQSTLAGHLCTSSPILVPGTQGKLSLGTTVCQHWESALRAS